jgi:ribonuclease MRP protein subunit RMP1
MAPDQAQPSAHQAALAKLQPLAPVLAGFNHRNRNQHRHARWWAAFGSLRRNVGRLISEVEVAAARPGPRAGSKRRKREGRDGADRGDAAEERARWMRDHAVPEAYL